MNNHTYFIDEGKNDWTLGHTSQLKDNPWLFEGLTIVKILKTNSDKKATIKFEEYIAKECIKHLKIKIKNKGKKKNHGKTFK